MGGGPRGTAYRVQGGRVTLSALVKFLYSEKNRRLTSGLCWYMPFSVESWEHFLGTKIRSLQCPVQGTNTGMRVRA